MSAFNGSSTSSRFAKYRALFVALAIVLVGGVGFAATGGTEALKKIFVFINIDGEVNEFEVDENSESTWTFQTEEGGEATVHLKNMAEPDGEWVDAFGQDGEAQFRTVEVEMTREDGDSDTTIDVEIAGAPPGGRVVIEPCGSGQFEPVAANEDEALAEIIKGLVGDHEGPKTIRILRGGADCGNFDEGAGLSPDLSEQTGDSSRGVKVLRTKLAAEGDEGTEVLDVNAEVDENGLATVRITSPDGTEKVMRIDVSEETE